MAQSTDGYHFFLQDRTPTKRRETSSDVDSKPSMTDRRCVLSPHTPPYHTKHMHNQPPHTILLIPEYTHITDNLHDTTTTKTRHRTKKYTVTSHAPLTPTTCSLFSLQSPTSSFATTSRTVAFFKVAFPSFWGWVDWEGSFGWNLVRKDGKSGDENVVWGEGGG